MPSTLFFFNDTATTEIYTLSLHDALPISPKKNVGCSKGGVCKIKIIYRGTQPLSSTSRTQSGIIHMLYYSKKLVKFQIDRKSTRLNSSHQIISYAVFSFKKKKPTSKT